MARGSWAQGRLLTKQSWAVVKANRYLLAFPTLGFLVSLVPLAIFWIPAAWLIAGNSEILGIALAIIGIFATQVVITLFGAALVASVDGELAGRDSSVGHGLGVAFSRFGALIAWAVVSTIATLLLSAIRGNGNGGLASVILRSVLAAAAGIAWSLITFFALPFIVLERQGVITAVKSSASLLKKSWGTQISGGIRIGGLIGLLIILPAILAIVGGVVLAVIGAWVAGVPLIVIGVIVFAIGALLISTMKGIFSVVLFRYAKDGVVEGGFTAEQLQAAVASR